MTEHTQGIVSELRGRPVVARGVQTSVTDIIIADVAYSTFQPGNLKVGDRVGLEFDRNGQFCNVKKLTILQDTPGQTKLTDQNITLEPVKPAAPEPKPAPVVPTPAPKFAPPQPINAVQSIEFWASLKIAAMALNTKCPTPDELRDYAAKLRAMAPHRPGQ